MLTINVKSNIDAVRANLDQLRLEQLPYATKLALDGAAYEIQQYHRKIGLDRHIIGGATPSTKRALVYSKAPSKHILAAEVFFLDWANDYMSLLVYGGVNTSKTGVILAPTYRSALETTKARDKYGNIKFTKSTKTNFTKKAYADKHRYFIGFPKGRPRTEQYRGIWERLGIRKSKTSKSGYTSGKQIQQLVRFVRGSQQVTPKYPFYEISADWFATVFPRKFKEGMERALRNKKSQPTARR